MKTISIYDSLLVLGRGIGQVMFQNNAFRFVNVGRNFSELVAVGSISGRR